MRVRLIANYELAGRRITTASGWEDVDGEGIKVMYEMCASAHKAGYLKLTNGNRVTFLPAEVLRRTVLTVEIDENV